MTIRHTPLPGVGTQYDFATENGHHISVVVHHDGRRFLGFYGTDDPDACLLCVSLTPTEATALAHLVAPAAADAVRTDGVDLVSENLPVGPRSPCVGRVLGDIDAPARTGASIVAVLRRTGAHPSPGPGFRLAIGDNLVAVGTREAVDALAETVAGG
jgi:TrkA domain protein